MSNKRERRKWHTKDTCIAKYLHRLLTDEECREELEELVMGSESAKLRLMWEILFETETEDVALLEHRIFLYGSFVKEHDYFGREVFLGLVSLLNQIKNKEKTE